jgi:hypothetical protein
MNYATSFQERTGGSTIGREAELNLASLEENCTRLRSWASIWGIGLAGTPFFTVRDGHVSVAVLTKKPHDANPETGVHTFELPSGMSLFIQDVPLDEFAAVTADLSSELGDSWEEAGSPEFHRSKDGFGRGTIIVPLQAAAASPQPREAATTTA